MEQHDLLLISDYLAGDLPEQDREAFAQRLTKDESFAALFRSRQAEINALRAIGRAEAKAALKAQFAGFQAHKDVSPRRIWPLAVLAIAAAIALLVLFRLSPWQAAPAPRELALAYLEPYPLTVERGLADTGQSDWDAASAAYQAGDFAAALPLFRSLHATLPDDPQITLSLAECLSQTGSYAEAAALLRPLAEASPFQDAAQWRLALNYLLAGQDALALPLLESIGKGPHYRQAQATTLLKVMENRR
jgi:tetratricopeptide (TPR) repeat protein